MTRLPSSAVLAMILDQHAHLRELVAACEAQTVAFEEGRAGAAELAAAVAGLRRAFAEHTRFEESVLRPLFRSAGASGPVDVERMAAEHEREHLEVDHALSAAASVRAALGATLRHLADEEHYFASLHGAADSAATVDI